MDKSNFHKALGNLRPRRAISILLISLAVAWTAPSAILAEELGPSFHVGGLPVGAPAAEVQIDPSVAGTGSTFLVVWSDSRSISSSDIYGVRVRADGTLLDDSGITVSSAANSQDSPAATCGTSEYFVVWKDDRGGSSDIHGSRIGTDGTVVDPSGIPISTANAAQGYPAVAYGDSLYFVAWVDLRDETTTHIYGARVGLDGTVLDPDGIAISTAAATGESFPAVAYDGVDFLVVWQDSRNGGNDIYGARVTTGGVVLDPSGIEISAAPGDQALPAVCSGGASSIVVWEDARNGTLSDIYGSRVGADGTVLDPAGLLICGNSADQINAAVTYDGTVWLVVWNDLRAGGVWNVYASRIDSTGAVLDPGGFGVCTFHSQQFNPAVAFADSIYLVAWHDSRNGPKDIYGARVKDDTTVLESWLLISKAASQQANPALASDGSNYLAVWEDLRLGTGRDIRGLRFEPDGTLLDASSIRISAASGDQTLPSVASGGDMWLVVWQDARGTANDVYGARLSGAGVVLDSAGTGISVETGAQECPAVASNSTDYLVVWQDARSGSYDIYGARVSASGSVLDTGGFAISAAPGDQTHPAVAFDGADYLVVWQDYRSGSSYDIYGARVSTSGAVLDGAGIAVSIATGSQEHPAVAFDGLGLLVVWQDRRSGPYGDIYGSRVACEGTVLDPAGFGISTATYDQVYPAIAFEGDYYFVAWQDSRRTTRPDIFGARVQSDAAVLDPTGMVICAEAYNQLAPAVAAWTPCQVMIAYPSFTHAPVYGSNRIWANSFGAPAGVDTPDAIVPASQMQRVCPNPFASSTRLIFDLAERERVSVRIYDVEGRVVAELFEGAADAGRHEIGWDGKDQAGERVAPGLYFCRLATPNGASIRKMVLVE